MPVVAGRIWRHYRPDGGRAGHLEEQRRTFLRRGRQPDADGKDETRPAGGNLAGTIYVGDKGIGVQSETAGGSKGISGDGPDGDELLRFAYSTPVFGDTLDLYLHDVEVKGGAFKNDVLQIELFFVGGPSVVRSSTDVFAAYTKTGRKDGFVDFSLLDGIGGVGGLTGFEFRVYEGHALVSGVENPSTIPAPVTIALMGMGLPVILLGHRRKARA